ncbi:MAG: type II toxin-antitoxin system prevent-host-death family antitoxin [Armatimonadota bacterium]|nr:type II toxin-antitoxin system prevent-host-death family antitoxin [Armatimonadota bacterium]MDR7455809.1 type II toxin-antitoxin system prevent-host-death family antitoxin [Armatimonadota bacterium]
MPITRLKARLSEYVDAVRSGKEIIVTDRGRPVARLIAVSGDALRDPRTAELIRLGLARPASRPLPPDFWTLPRPRDPKGRVLAALIEERAEER